MNHLCRVALPLPIVCLLVACASQSPDAPGPSSIGATTGALVAASGATPALETLRRGGSFMFSLDESGPATLIHSRCDAEAAGDKAKADACYGLVRQRGATEGMRFTLDRDQHVVWTSFGTDDAGKEAIFLEGPLAVAADGEHGVVGTFAAPPHGTQMEGKTALPTRPVHFEFVDATTMIMTDEVKGRLVFHRLAH